MQEYEIERQELLKVEADDISGSQWADLHAFSPSRAPFEGVERVRPTAGRPGADHLTAYRYQGPRRHRVGHGRRSTTAGATGPSYVVSSGKPDVFIDAPANVRLSREHDNSAVTVRWTAPPGELDGYTVQRQELVIVQGSTIFANITTLGGSSWLSDSTLMYEDGMVLPQKTYEYRVAAVNDDSVGEYSDWFRTSPFTASLGEAPGNFGREEGTARDDRREFWIRWDEVGGADDYELQILKFDPHSGHQMLMAGVFVSDPTYFYTAYNTTKIRVRGRMQDDTQCGSDTGDRCVTEWTPWIETRYVATMAMEDLTTPVSADAETMELRDNLETAIRTAIDPLGGEGNAGLVLEGGVLLLMFATAVATFAIGHRKGVAPLGFGAGVAAAVLILFLGIRLVDLPVTWGVVSLVIILVGGGAATVASLGLAGRS